MKARILALVVVLLLPVFAFAGSSCVNASPLRGNGDGTKFDFVVASGFNYYQFPVTAGRSYSVETSMVYDDGNSGADLTVAPFTDSGCLTALTGTVNTAGANPALAANGNRFSFTASATGNVYLKIGNANASVGHYIDVVVNETTLFCPRWSTQSGLLNVYGIQNTTSQVAHVNVLATIDYNGVSFGSFGTASQTYTIQPGARVLIALYNGAVAPNINVLAGGGGFLTITHDLPAKAIVMDGYFANSTMLVPALVTSVR